MSLNLLKILGKGSYGTTYLTDKKIEGFSSVVKVIRRSDQYVTADVITEVIAQILIAENTKEVDYSDIGLKGPFVPRVFLFAKDEFYYYILNETMDYNFDKMITTSTNHNKVKYAVIQIATILDYLFHTFRFNHRDFKADNIMFSEKNGVRLIDFGFCCMYFKGMIISPGYAYPKSSLRTCSSRTRDLNAIFFYMLNYTKYSKISCPIKRVMRTLMYDKDGDPKDWANSYPKYNARMEVKNMYPDVVIGAFLKLNFIEDRECSEVGPSWASEIKEINSGVIATLNEREIKSLNSDILIEYIKKNRPFPFIKKLLGFSTDKKVRSVCQKLLGLPNNTDSNLSTVTAVNKTVREVDKTAAVAVRQAAVSNKPTALGYLPAPLAKRQLNRDNSLNMPARKSFKRNVTSNNSIELTDDILIKSANITDENKLNNILDKTYSYKYINYKNPEGKTPLMAAAGALNLNLVKKLMKFPFIVADSQNANGDNALHYAMKASINTDENAFERKMEIIDAIIAVKPQMSDQKNKKGMSPKELLIKMKRDGGRKTRKNRK